MGRDAQMTQDRIFLDPDFRPHPKTKLFCVICQKDLKIGGKWRYIYVTDDGMSAIPLSEKQGTKQPAGSACIKRVGLGQEFLE